VWICQSGPREKSGLHAHPRAWSLTLAHLRFTDEQGKAWESEDKGSLDPGRKVSLEMRWWMTTKLKLTPEHISCCARL